MKDNSNLLLSYAEALTALNLSEGYTAEELKSAYRTEIRLVHPDSGGSGDPARLGLVQDANLLLTRALETGIKPNLRVHHGKNIFEVVCN